MGKNSSSNFRLRHNAPMLKKENKKSKNAKQIKQPKAEAVSAPLLFPAGQTAFKAILSARFCAAIWSIISDCDETFNYWEPMHFLVYGKGMQTWEYSPQFALRSYTYILFHAVPAYIYAQLLQPNPLLIFYFTRCLLGLMCTFAEVYFYKAVCREFGLHIGRLCLLFQIFSAGMFISSTAFLPSTFAMYFFMGMCSAWWTQKYPLAIFFTALGSLLGWPFAALLGVPLVFDMLGKKMYKDFVIWSGISASVILFPMILIDSTYYGKLVIAPLNIVMYNVLGGAGPDLYGTEPISYYLVNGFLNFNVVWVLALLSPFALIAYIIFVPARNKSPLTLPFWLSISPMLLWFAVFFLQPHKEERFLFPIYPMICLCAAISLDIVQKLVFRIWTLIKPQPYGTHYLDKTMIVAIIFVAISSLLSVSRIFAVYKNYHAPMDLLMNINKLSEDSNTPTNLCIGKDWYRFPTSFFLPNTEWNVRFIKSEFDGMLPAPYKEIENSTKIVHDYFNDRNREDPRLYFDIDKCHYLFDLNFGRQSALEPNYANKTDRWNVLLSFLFIDAERSSKFFRSFYVPFLSSRYTVFGNFTLLQSKLKIK